MQVFQIGRYLGGQRTFQVTDGSEIDRIGIGQLIELACQLGAFNFQFPVFRQHLEGLGFRIKFLETRLLQGQLRAQVSGLADDRTECARTGCLF